MNSSASAARTAGGQGSADNEETRRRAAKWDIAHTLEPGHAGSVAATYGSRLAAALKRGPPAATLEGTAQRRLERFPCPPSPASSPCSPWPRRPAPEPAAARRRTARRCARRRGPTPRGG